MSQAHLGFFSFRLLVSLLVTGNQEEQSFSPDILNMNFPDTIISVMAVQATVPVTLGLAVLVPAWNRTLIVGLVLEKDTESSNRCEA